jgi:AmmeMemoRadiSam system protein A
MIERAPQGLGARSRHFRREMQDEVETTGTLSASERATLLSLARGGLAAHLLGQPAPDLGESARTLRLSAPGAAFVTLRTRGDLRGCIGTTRFERPLHELVPELAVSAASADRRFEPVRQDELADVRIAISVLTPLEPARVDAIEIGRHGLVVRCRQQSGLLLPQVASERGWDARTFLAETSRKAGLDADAWKRRDAQVFWFEAERFSEDGRD